MLFMVTETFRDQDMIPVYRRFRDAGRGLISASLGRKRSPSRRAVMGRYANRPSTTVLLAATARVVIGLNLMLLVETLFS